MCVCVYTYMYIYIYIYIYIDMYMSRAQSYLRCAESEYNMQNGETKTNKCIPQPPVDWHATTSSDDLDLKRFKGRTVHLPLGRGSPAVRPLVSQ